MRTDLTSTKIKYLIAHGANTADHSGRTLLDHLKGTSQVVKEMGAPEYLQDAGLFHTVYGTVAYMPLVGIISNRDEVKELIGEQAEEIAYWFCVLDSPRLEQIHKFEGQLKKDLLLLNSANDMEQKGEWGEMMTLEEAYD